ncbi:MAG: glycosyltransferase family 4 protein [Candidatus Marsarchaeota archaeon]|nr:glycosyltransferase family 4 protein [Candidatus Marsarchaeota archaeon]
MKIAIFHNLASGGAKRALYNFVRHLVTAGHAVDAFVPSTADEEFLPLRDCVRKLTVFPVKNTLAGLTLSTFRYLPPVRVSLADLERTQKEIATVVNHGDYDVVLSEQDRYTLSPFFLRYVEKPTIYYCQQPSRFSEVILRNLRRSRWGGNSVTGLVETLARKYFGSKVPGIDRRNASFAKYILANSYFSHELILRSYGLNSSVCYLGIDTDTFKPLDVSRGPYVMSVGMCNRTKGYDFIIRSLGLIEANKRPQFVIVANAVDGDWRQHLQELARQCGVTLEVKSLVEDAELAMLYNRAQLCVYAPYLEPFGLVPLEAMACGTPVVAVKEGGVRESVVDGKTGVLTERDEAAFADAVTTLLSDGTRSAQMGQRGIEAIHDFWTLKHAGERLLGHLERVASTSP